MVSNTFKPNYDYVRSEMMTVQNNEGNMMLSTHHHGSCANNYGTAPSTNKTRHGTSKDVLEQNIYSRPIELAQSNAKIIEGNSNGSYRDVMTWSCPSSTLLRHTILPSSNISCSNGASNTSEVRTTLQNLKCQSISKGNEIYSNGNSTAAIFAPTISKSSDRTYSCLMNNSPPPRPPSLLRRNKPMNTSPHHHHYYHHQRDSGHASIGSSEDLASAPPLPPRYSSEFKY